MVQKQVVYGQVQVFIKSSQRQVLLGATGATGATGANGNTIFTGSTVPAN